MSFELHFGHSSRRSIPPMAGPIGFLAHVATSLPPAHARSGFGLLIYFGASTCSENFQRRHAIKKISVDACLALADGEHRRDDVLSHFGIVKFLDGPAHQVDGSQASRCRADVAVGHQVLGRFHLDAKAS